MSAQVRAATTADVPTIFELLRDYAIKGRLLPRSTDEICAHLHGFVVAEHLGKVRGCGSLEVFTEELGEVRSLAVHPTTLGTGYGRAMVEYLQNEALGLGLQRLMALTYVPGFFHKLGFRIVAMESLPEKVFSVCVTCPRFDHCDEIAMQKVLVPA
ncbi:MAG TPA: N-acetyltransferase [Gammaproteobacteria bacterium]|jgi:amino-acid N-acetyltransferase|nr:N-acetyltransferase [Arenicellales bacterium]MDP6854200.1 N-acetyltransferase [Arenicellales bacterium]MDP6948712.1 N-acetyltransferase [Arenicellales bacterium]HCY12293.1 N-acetyltransferase [Gammaproteobacteria bacterium]|tara:strand:+ start:6047 stop:6514 length:468 start_codon:yes stop_codon:yes gene_type:complete